ncbi:MAG: hypothetical protein ACLTSG_01175 [Lachnospiraceae bacterium]
MLLNLLINRARARGEHFALHPLDPHYDENSPRPRFLVALLPLIVLFVLFNVVGLDINICIIISTALSVILFKDQLHGSSLRNLLSTGASESIHMSMTVAAICGFAGVVTETEAFTQMLNAIISIDISPMLICAIVVAVMCMLTGGSSTGQLISLPLIAPKLTELGLSVGAIHRIGCFAATTLDSLPYSGAILMLLPLCRMKLREVYPPLFVTTVVATTCGTAAVAITTLSSRSHVRRRNPNAAPGIRPWRGYYLPFAAFSRVAGVQLEFIRGYEKRVQAGEAFSL